MIEIEIRALIENRSEIETRLLELGYEPEESFEQLDIIHDKPDASLFKSGQKIRIRNEKGHTTLTYKGHFQGDSSASRRMELDINLPGTEAEKMSQFLSAVGYPVCFQIPKSRKVYRKEALSVYFDEWPILGCLLEIEGDEEGVKELAKKIAADVAFANYRLSELFRMAEAKTGKCLSTLKMEYEAVANIGLGKIELLCE
jgi:predicted adenylyl cyclase CyaB